MSESPRHSDLVLEGDMDRKISPLRDEKKPCFLSIGRIGRTGPLKSELLEEEKEEKLKA